MIATIEHTERGPALLVHGVRVNQAPVGDTTLQALADQINAAAGWRPIETAPKDGTVFDIWLGNATQNDADFYCTRGTLRSSGWHWMNDKFRPEMHGLHMPVFVQPTHWRPLPEPPQ